LREGLSRPDRRSSGVLPLQVDLLDLRNGVLASLGDIELVLDFDAARSVVKVEFGGTFAGDDIALADGASVSLQAVDPDGKVTVVRAGVVEADGTWNLTPVPAGTGYNLVVTKPGFRTAVVTGIDLAEGDVVAVPSFALGADATEIAANTALVDGTVDSAAAVAVQALNKLDGGNAVEIAFATVAEGEGAFAMSLPALAPMVAPYVPGEAPAFSPMGEPALHDFVAVGTIGTAAVAGATTDVTLSGGDMPNVVDIPLAEI